ncbi:MAG: hypothetical protein DBX91_14055 [Subdoligranulum variabile]|uniref:tape measure protein n=1 Tax=Gemmiger formicilis TaxID=745368 RepID=UPI000D78D904|nr:MAG: hypothetical protein DBX91_14055 [Subdoligranulum variabile]
MADVGEVRYKATVDTSGVSSDANKAEKEIKDSMSGVEKKSKQVNDSIGDGFDKSSQKASSSWKSAAGGIAKALGTAFVGVTTAAGAGVVSLAKMGTDFNAQMETYQTSFEVMTGDAEEAARITEQLKDTAAKTPFAITDLADTTQLLMNYGLTADEAMSRMQMLGDISQGSADKMSRIAMAYGQMSSAGKVQLEDIKQMIEAGFNPLTEISETTGESMESLYKRISDGTLTVDEITASMQRSTSEGGKYFQSMEKQSQTLSGQFSTMQDNFAQFAGEVVEGITPALTAAMDAVNGLFEDDTLKDTLSGLFDVLAQIVTESLPPLVDMLGELMPLFAQVVNDVLPVAVDLFTQLLPPLIQLVEAVLPAFLEIIEALLPPLAEIVNAVVPVLVSLLEALMPILSTLLEALSPILDLSLDLLQPILDLITQALNPLIEVLGYLIDVAIMPLQVALGALAGVFQAIFSVISDTVINAVNTVQGVLEGIITFLTGVFTGNWEQAFNGLVQIALSALVGLAGLVKAPINAVIDIVNGFIKGINNIKIPDWIPAIGGASVNIPLIPRLKKGLPFIPKDYFPAYLDYGERVLTKEENAVYTAAGGILGMRRNLDALNAPRVGGTGENVSTRIEVPLYLDGREIARASAWYMGEQLSWEER